MAKVDCSEDVNYELCIQFKVGAFPTVVLLYGDMYYQFIDDFNYKNIKEFAVEDTQGKMPFITSAKDRGRIPQKVYPS